MIALALLAASAPSGAISPRQIPLQEQAERADVIITADAEKLMTCAPARFKNNCVLFRNVNILRDNAHHAVPDHLVVNLDMGIDEQLFRCCSIGATYLMALKERPSGYAPFFGGASFRLLQSVGGAARFNVPKAQ
jgi:hypothetical protein